MIQIRFFIVLNQFQIFERFFSILKTSKVQKNAQVNENVVKSFEALAQADQKKVKKVHMSGSDADFCRRMILKHKDDYAVGIFCNI